MRWICLTLLVANGILGLWQLALSQGWLARPQAPAVPLIYRATPGVAPLKLLAELPLETPAAATPETPAPAVSEAAPTVDASAPGDHQQCLMLGPYEKLEEATAAIGRLAAADIRASAKQIEVTLVTNYLVYLPPLSNRAEARVLLDSLKSAGVDSYIIPKGELVNGIALGSFDNRAAAEQQRDLLQKKGLAPSIRDGQQQQQQEIWVALAPGEDAKAAPELKTGLLHAAKSLEERQILCTAIASLKNIL